MRIPNADLSIYPPLLVLYLCLNSIPNIISNLLNLLNILVYLCYKKISQWELRWIILQSSSGYQFRRHDQCSLYWAFQPHYSQRSCQMNFDPASMYFPLFPHPFGATGYLDSCGVNRYHNRLIAERYRVGQANLQLGTTSPDICIVGRSNLGNQIPDLSQEAFYLPIWKTKDHMNHHQKLDKRPTLAI